MKLWDKLVLLEMNLWLYVWTMVGWKSDKVEYKELLTARLVANAPIVIGGGGMSLYEVLERTVECLIFKAYVEIDALAAEF